MLREQLRHSIIAQKKSIFCSFLYLISIGVMDRRKRTGVGRNSSPCSFFYPPDQGGDHLSEVNGPIGCSSTPTARRFLAMRVAGNSVRWPPLFVRRLDRTVFDHTDFVPSAPGATHVDFDLHLMPPCCPSYITSSDTCEGDMFRASRTTSTGAYSHL